MFFVIICCQQNLQAQSAQLEVVLGDPLPPPCPFSLPFPPLCPSCSPPQAPLLPHLWSQPFPHSLRQRHPCRLAGECWATLPLTRTGGPSPLCLHFRSKSSSNSVHEPSRDVFAGKSAESHWPRPESSPQASARPVSLDLDVSCKPFLSGIGMCPQVGNPQNEYKVPEIVSVLKCELFWI